jgi:hypothetical protein
MPKEPHLIQRVFRRLTREGAVAVCYEAGVSGYDLYRQITACGAACQVIAPALTPRRPGQRIKTDRRDAVKLVRLFRAGEAKNRWMTTRAGRIGSVTGSDRRRRARSAGDHPVTWRLGFARTPGILRPSGAIRLVSCRAR